MRGSPILNQLKMIQWHGDPLNKGQRFFLISLGIQTINQSDVKQWNNIVDNF